ncbi:MAG TPA: MFS transporter [Polyangiaceae bacterium]|jgi:dipeptide/tripeptide permease
MSELGKSLRELRAMPRGLWLVVIAFSADLMAYYGVLPLMPAYMHADIGLSDSAATIPVSIFTGAVTVFWILVGGVAEKMGVRRGLVVALLLCVVGRAIYAGAIFTGGAKLAVVGLSLLVVAVAEGMMQSAAYLGVKQFTTEKNASMGYALLYGVMNLFIFFMGFISSSVRTRYDALRAAGHSPVSGVDAVNWACVAITLIGAVFAWVTVSKRIEASAPRASAKTKSAETSKGPSPFRDARFIFFIFMLLPVRTLFAHQWLTLPDYILRAYPKNIADHMEWIVDWINPLVVFVGTPLITAITRKRHVFTMMIVGTAVSALPTFFLCGGPSLSMLIAYQVIFSIGEAMWSSRFLEYAAELAPEGRVAQYMGLANIPWLLAKSITGLYAGALLHRYVPEHGPEHSATLWLIYGLTGLATPIGLVLARGWVVKGLKTQSAS